MTRTGIWLFPDLEAGALVELAVEAERLGLDELWLGDEGPARDPFALLAAVAVRTQRLRLGIAVTNPYLRLPAIAATSALTLQELSGGRFALGFGTGGGYALAPVGVYPVTPAADTERALRAARAVATGAAFADVGHAIAPRPLPLFIGSRGPRLNRFASREADGAFIGGVPLGLLGRVLGWARSAREIETAVYLNAAFDERTIERRRGDLARVLRDSPAYVREHVGDRIVDEYIVHGDVAGRVREIAREHRPTSIGISLLGANPFAMLPQAAAALGALRTVPA